MSDSTIAAISTAQGMGGIGVIRISGDKAIQVADKVFVAISGKKLSSYKGYTCAYGEVVYNNEKIDECVATVFLAPNSYTGENVVELSCHGGIYITKQVLRAVLDSGATLALPGEFTKRAFLNSKIDLTQAEAVMDIISAKSKSAAKSALSVHQGRLSKEINSIKDALLLTASHLCAWADYPEEDIADVEYSSLLDALVSSKESLAKLLDSYDNGKVLREGIDTVIVGRPNVGKSTLMNLITGYDKSIVTDIAGTTRDVVEDTAVIGDITLNISDTAGIREATDVIEKIGVDKAKNKIETSQLIIAVFDASNELDDDDRKLIESIKGNPCIAVINKDDLEIKIDIQEIKSVTNQIVYMSAKNSTGYDKLKQAIENVAGTQQFDASAAVLSNERQRKLAKNAYDELINAISTLEIGMTYDAVTVALESAIECLCELTGERVTDTVVDNVFHNFCVGK